MSYRVINFWLLAPPYVFRRTSLHWNRTSGFVISHVTVGRKRRHPLVYTRQVHVHTAVAQTFYILSYRSYGSVDDARTTVFATSIHTTTLTTLC